MIVHQLTLFAMFVLFTKRSGGKGMGWGKDLVLVGHEGGKAKSLKVFGVGWKLKERNLYPWEEKQTHLGQTRLSLDLPGKFLKIRTMANFLNLSSNGG